LSQGLIPSRHGFAYPVDDGYVPGLSGDGVKLDGYVLGVDERLDRFRGRCIAVIQRLDDQDDKPMVGPNDVGLEDEEIRRWTYFQEQSFRSETS